MTSRPSDLTTAHDTGVAREAEELERAGWTVTAEVSGWDDPEPVGGHVPDIVATKAGTVRYIEVETDEAGDHSQHADLREAASRRRGGVFYAILVDANGRRIRYTDTLP